MKNTIGIFSSFFAKAVTMRIAFAFTVVLFGLNMIAKCFISLYSLLIVDGVFLICVIFLYVSFKHHNKNVQKGLMGAVLMWYLYDEVNYVVSGIIFNDEMFDVYNNTSGIMYIILSIVTAVMFAGLFVNHFIINSDHHSRPVNVFINQILVIIIAIISLISIPCQLIVLAGQSWDMAEAVTWHMGLSALVMLIASYESRLDAYRIDRETAGWTEDAGYPAGYVHDYEKKGNK